MRPAPTLDELRRAPKVLLHDHLDGGLRPATVIELAHETGYTGLPTTDEADLTRWFTEGAARQDLVLYLETFDHTVGVMQTKDALRAGGPGVRRGPRRRRRRLRRGALRPRAAPARGPHARRGGRVRGRGLPARHRRHRAHDRHDRHRDAPRRPLHRDRRAGRPPPRRRRGRLRHRRAARPATRRPATSTRSSSSRRRTSTSPSTPGEAFGLPVDLGGGAAVRRRAARPRRAHRRRHRRSPTTAGPRSAGWPASSATGGCRSRCARPPT